MPKMSLDEALPTDDGPTDDYDRDEDFDGDREAGNALTLKGTDELAMDYEVFGRYVQSGTENGRPKYLGPRTEGSRPSIAFTTAGDGKPTWWVYDASDGECFYAEADTATPPLSGWRKLYGEKDLEVTVVHDERGGGCDEVVPPKIAGGKDAVRERSRSPRQRCPW
eukprot:TRINITY_DN10037_c0_g3_i1.p1 TRINITY_DN10037_c0_g3~~TRINITY_DN10037_c0_g3_i1.p1  ORF type:complete len:193 (+),score=30.60 TRINITY_DN10037_c0_g3_i1:84-581(+)